MIIAGVAGERNKDVTFEIINTLMNIKSKKASFIEFSMLTSLSDRQVKEYLDELKKNETELLVIKVGIQDFFKDFINFLRFDVIIFTDKSDDIEEINNGEYKAFMKKAFCLLNENGIAILNSDDSELAQVLQGIKKYIVTYGFNKRASITTSSVGDLVETDNMMFCLQRSIYTKNGKIIEPHEFLIKSDLTKSDPYNLLAAASFMVVLESFVN